MSSKPPRKFAPVPIEETTKSSRQSVANSEQSSPAKRFKPELIEESTKSSKETSEKPTEDGKPKPRRFAPEPVEHTTKSSKGTNNNAAEATTASKPRRFAPQLVDEVEKSSKDKPPRDKTPHVKFKPEPVATTYGGNRKAKRQNVPTESKAADAETEKKPPRKFTPILLDTATRSRRAGDENAPISQDYRTEYGYHAHAHEHWRRVNGEDTATATSEQAPEVEVVDFDPTPSAPSRGSSPLRSVSPLDGSAPKRANCLKPERKHSFRTPDLETIESSESEGDTDESSFPQTPVHEGSPITVSSSYELFKHATRRRESTDESWQHYLLDLERKKAQERLEEQALAAFPNADFGHEHPDHYFVNDDDSGDFEIEDRPTTWDGSDDDVLEMARRESTSHMSWERSELQRHAEVMQQERNAKKSTVKEPSKSPWGKLGVPLGGEEVEAEMKSMLERARPPMLGDDIIFPRCESPDPARFDVTQGSATLRNQMCYLTAAADAERKRSGEDGGLWKSAQPESKRVSTVKSPVSPKSPSSKGLWGGFCIDDGENGAGFSGKGSPGGPSGLMTPKHDTSTPSFSDGRPHWLRSSGTPTKNKSKTDLQRLNSKLVSEREIDSMMEREYPDSFITQVYNYLSLGYPAIARAFDEELSKIGRIPLWELRQDDEAARSAPRGYIKLGSDFEGGGGEGMVEENCMRWRALKRYVREWAKQEKNWMPSDGVDANWGLGARRGSWGI